jgi:hypothetical protein
MEALVRRERITSAKWYFARVLAARLLEQSTSEMNVTCSAAKLWRPIAPFCVFATLYADDVRIMRGHVEAFVFSVPTRTIQDRLLILVDCPTVICSND